MKYEKKLDRKNHIYRVIGIGFETCASNEFIEEVIQEVFQMNTMPSDLMTAAALYDCLKCCDEYVLVRMQIMPIGSSFKYMKYKITRHSKYTYTKQVNS